MRLGIASGLVLADPEIERIAGHERLDAPPARRAPVVERQVAIDDVGHEIRAPHREPAHRIGLDVVLVLVEVVGAREPVLELVRRVEDEIGVVDEIHEVRRSRAGDQDGRRRAGVDDAVPGVHRDREQRSPLPLEDVPLAVSDQATPRWCRGLPRQDRPPHRDASPGSARRRRAPRPRSSPTCPRCRGAGCRFPGRPDVSRAPSAGPSRS